MRERGLKFPVDLYIEGNDQYRGWFNSSTHYFDRRLWHLAV
jgi:isoleucyl-tRNA synthetase